MKCESEKFQKRRICAKTRNDIHTEWFIPSTSDFNLATLILQKQCNMNFQPISNREKEILYLIAHEFTSKEIAQKLYISRHTAESHRKNLIQKMGVRNTAGLIRAGFEKGILSIACMFCFVLLSTISIAQIDMELSNGLKVGQTTTETNGTIRWNDASQDFEGWNGQAWVSFTMLNGAQNFNHVDTTSILPLCADTVISDGMVTNTIGRKVAIHDSTIVVTGSAVGSHRHVQFYNLKMGVWNLDTTIILQGGFADDGNQIELTDDLLIIAYRNFGDGAVEIFKKSNDIWERDTILTEPQSIFYANDIAYNGKYLAVGDPGAEVDGIESAGKIFIYENITGIWTLIASFENPDPMNLQSFGEELEASSNHIFVADNSKLHIYAITGNIISSFQSYDVPIQNMSYYGSKLAIGNNRRNDGEVYIFDVNSLMFSDTLTVPDGEGEFGAQVFLYQDFLLVTDLPSAFNSASENDLVILYSFDGNDWIEVKRITDPVGQPRDYFGNSLSLHGTNYVISSHRADINGNVDQGKFFIGTIK